MKIHHQRQGNALIPEKENHDLLDCSLRTTDPVHPVLQAAKVRREAWEAKFDICLSN